MKPKQDKCKCECHNFYWGGCTMCVMNHEPKQDKEWWEEDFEKIFYPNKECAEWSDKTIKQFIRQTILEDRKCQRKKLAGKIYFRN